MNFMAFRVLRRILVSLALLSAGAGFAHAQTATAILRGQVTDPSGASIAGAKVVVATAAGKAAETTTDRDGNYEVKDLAPRTYTVRVTVKGFIPYENPGVQIAAGQEQRLDVALQIFVKEEKVEVNEDAARVDVNPESNASTIVLSGKDLEALSDDPDELQQDLQALAGPSAGPNGGQIYIDGFTGGQLPPKASIREIRINQNPFSAEYDKLGYGRIEIFTKPGTDNWHGQVFASGNSSAFNTQNPFAVSEPAYHSTQFSANIGGPLSKKASMFFNFERRDIDEVAVANGTALDANFNPVPFSEAVPNPRTRMNFSPRLDYQVGPNNTLTARYQYWRNTETNDGIQSFSQVSQGINTISSEQTFQITDTQIYGAKVVNETRFQFIRSRNQQTPQSLNPTLSVLDSFVNGGNSGGTATDAVNRYELQNYTSWVFAKHTLKFGARLRVGSDSNESTSGFNGVFTFGSRIAPGCIPTPSTPCPILTPLQAFQITEQGLAGGQTLAQIVNAGGGPTQFSIVAGSPAASVTLVDAGLYIQDDWKIRPNLTFSYGLRFETQNNIDDHADVAPRFGLAWGIGAGKNKQTKTVLRAGWGMFYDRFTQDLVLQASRLNGFTQQQFLLTPPTLNPLPTLQALMGLFVNPPPAGQPLTGVPSTATIYQIDPNLHAPYIMQTAISLERQLTKISTLTISYLNSRGVHQLLSRNINAPLPSGLVPNPSVGNIYQYESAGIFKQNQLIASGNVRAGQKLTLFAWYTLNYVNSDTSGPNSFPMNQYDLEADYGRAAYAVRQRVFFGGSVGLPHGFRLSPFMVAQSGQPFNITLGQQFNGDSIFNERPTFATLQTDPTKIKVTPFGTFDLAPVPGETLIPVNLGTSSPRFTLNVRLAKTFGFGKKPETAPADNAGASGGRGGGGGPRGGGGGQRGGGGGGPMGGIFGGSPSNARYNLTFSVSARNLFNIVNDGNFVGNLNSPQFGQANGLAGGPYSSSAANRKIDLQLQFTF
jgi:hypothetical protein